MYQLIFFSSVSALALIMEFVAYLTPSWLHQIEPPRTTIDVGLIYGFATTGRLTGGSVTHGITYVRDILPLEFTVGQAMIPISFVFLFIGMFRYIQAQQYFNDDATSSPYARCLHKQSLIFLVASGFFLLVHLLVFTITFALLLHRLNLTRSTSSSFRVLVISVEPDLFGQPSNINAVSFGYSWYLGWLTFGLILTSVLTNGIFYIKVFKDTPVPKSKDVRIV